jgi:hypothetical protein
MASSQPGRTASWHRYGSRESCIALPQRIWWESVDKACHAREYPKSQLGPFKPRYRPFRNVLFLNWIVSRPRSRGRRRSPSSPAGVGWAVVACGRSDPAPSLLRWLPAAPGRAGPGASLPQERRVRPAAHPPRSASSVCLMASCPTYSAPPGRRRPPPNQPRYVKIAWTLGSSRWGRTSPCWPPAPVRWPPIRRPASGSAATGLRCQPGSSSSATPACRGCARRPSVEQPTPGGRRL